MSAPTATFAASDLGRCQLPEDAGVPAWLVVRRAEALEWVQRHGFPARHDEDWRYLDLRGLLALPFGVEDDRAGAPGDGAGPGLDLGGPKLVFVNGELGLSRPDRQLGSSGLSSVSTALREQPDELETTFAPRPSGWYHAFDALNAARATDGAFIRIPAGAHADAPIQLVFLSLPGHTPTLASPRSVILAEAGSRVSLVVTHLGQPGQPVCTNAVMEIVCGEGAQVDYTEVQDAPDTAYHLSLLDVHQAAGSRVAVRTVSIGSVVARHEVRVTLTGERAEASLDGLYLPAGAQHHDHSVLVEHASAGATSRQLYKGVISGHGHGVFNGRIIVRPGADGTDAAQSNKNLLLSDQAEVDTRPRLEIHADDVRCAHGAAVGQLDPDALYYLRSRGIGRVDAERILVTAFAGELLGRIPDDRVRSHVAARVAERFSPGEENDQP